MIIASNFSDPENARTIYLAVGVLVLFAIAVTVVTVWWWKSSKVDHPVLGPLEVMSTRSWEDSDRLARRQALEGARLVHSDSPHSPAGGVAAYVPVPVPVPVPVQTPAPTLTDDELDLMAGNDVFDEYTRLTSGGVQSPARQAPARAPEPEVEPVYEIHSHDEYDQQDEHYDDEFGDVWGVQDAEEGLDAGFSIDPLLRRRDNG